MRLSVRTFLFVVILSALFASSFVVIDVFGPPVLEVDVELQIDYPDGWLTTSISIRNTGDSTASNVAVELYKIYMSDNNGTSERFIGRCPAPEEEIDIAAGDHYVIEVPTVWNIEDTGIRLGVSYDEGPTIWCTPIYDAELTAEYDAQMYVPENQPNIELRLVSGSRENHTTGWMADALLILPPFETWATYETDVAGEGAISPAHMPNAEVSVYFGESRGRGEEEEISISIESGVCWSITQAGIEGYKAEIKHVISTKKNNWKLKESGCTRCVISKITSQNHWVAAHKETYTTELWDVYVDDNKEGQIVVAWPIVRYYKLWPLNIYNDNNGIRTDISVDHRTIGCVSSYNEKVYMGNWYAKMWECTDYIDAGVATETDIGIVEWSYQESSGSSHTKSVSWSLTQGAEIGGFGVTYGVHKEHSHTLSVEDTSVLGGYAAPIRVDALADCEFMYKPYLYWCDPTGLRNECFLVVDYHVPTETMGPYYQASRQGNPNSLTFDQATTVEGNLTYMDGTPAAGVTVSFDGISNDTTGPDGDFSIPISQGAHTMTVDGPECGRALPTPNPQGITLTAGTYEGYLRVMNPSGLPLQGVQICFNDTGSITNCLTQSIGDYSVFLGGGTYNITCNVAGMNTLTLHKIASGQTTLIVVPCGLKFHNIPPRANAGVSHCVLPGTEVTLNASGSIDLDGQLVLYDWIKNGTPIFSDSSPIHQHVFDSVGDYNLTVVVHDNEGEFDSDWIMIYVREPLISGPSIVDVAVLRVYTSLNSSIWRFNSANFTQLDFDINATVQNQGDNPATFTVTLYNSGGSPLDSHTITNLSPGAYANVTFSTNNKEFDRLEGEAIVTADIPGEMNPADNSMTECVGSFLLIGDLDNNGEIDIFDLVKVARAYTETDPPGWIPEDINKDGTIDIFDMFAIALSYGLAYS